MAAVPDGLTRIQAAEPFAKAILAANWSQPTNTLTVLIPGRVHIIDKSGTVDSSCNGIVVYVRLHAGEHVYHLEGTIP